MGLWFVRGAAPTDPLSTDPPIVRTAGELAIESTLRDGHVFPRDAVVLEWQVVGASEVEGARYDVVVMTEDLAPVTRFRDLEVPSAMIPAAELASQEAGAELLWQVEVRLAEGTTTTSPTFFFALEGE